MALASAGGHWDSTPTLPASLALSGAGQLTCDSAGSAGGGEGAKGPRLCSALPVVRLQLWPGGDRGRQGEMQAKVVAEEGLQGRTALAKAVAEEGLHGQIVLEPCLSKWQQAVPCGH